MDLGLVRCGMKAGPGEEVGRKLMGHTLTDFGSGIAARGAGMLLNMEGATTCLKNARNNQLCDPVAEIDVIKSKV